MHRDQHTGPVTRPVGGCHLQGCWGQSCNRRMPSHICHSQGVCWAWQNLMARWLRPAGEDTSITHPLRSLILTPPSSHRPAPPDPPLALECGVGISTRGRQELQGHPGDRQLRCPQPAGTLEGHSEGHCRDTTGTLQGHWRDTKPSTQPCPRGGRVSGHSDQKSQNTPNFLIYSPV